MDATILRSDVYKLIHSGEAFDMQFVTCNRKKGTGGDLITAEGWMVLNARETSDVKGETDEYEEADTPLGDGGKDPNHEENGTVNVFNPANPGYHPVKVHYDLITTFNGKRVIN